MCQANTNTNYVKYRTNLLEDTVYRDWKLQISECWSLLKMQINEGNLQEIKVIFINH